jgi:hypothetical protein
MFLLLALFSSGRSSTGRHHRHHGPFRRFRERFVGHRGSHAHIKSPAPTESPKGEDDSTPPHDIGSQRANIEQKTGDQDEHEQLDERVEQPPPAETSLAPLEHSASLWSKILWIPVGFVTIALIIGIALPFLRSHFRKPTPELVGD